MYTFFAQPLQHVQGIGATLLKRFLLAGTECIGDLLFHLPRDYVDDRHISTIASLEEGRDCRIQGKIIQRSAHGFGAKRQVSLILMDETGEISLQFFHAAYMMRDARLQEGREIAVRGRPHYWGSQCQMQHPEWCVAERFVPSFMPRYGALAGLSGKRLSKLIDQALKLMPSHLVSPLDCYVDLSLQQALRLVHQPDDIHAAIFRQAERRLKSEELLVYLNMMQQQRSRAMLPAPMFHQDDLSRQLLASLPFDLTEGQKHAWQDIQNDLISGQRMHRLVQGDVGSGKTWVAALAILQVVQGTYQAALMAPTEVLAEQHYQTLLALFQPLNISMSLLTGSTSAAKRRKILSALVNGSMQLVVGTHALISEGVHFDRLGLAVVDEQHRFGVKQRWALTGKTGAEQEAVHLLAMTATPIPRTLAMALYGDMELSVMHGMPVGRKKIETRVMTTSLLPQLAAGMQRLLDEHGRIYWIVPRIDEDEASEDAISVAERVEQLQKRFPQAAVLGLHGRMKSKEKQQVLDAFAKGTCRLLVSTTVIEVGVNVPEARLIVIDHADHYGLAQLHQLRGRVGRSDAQSYCMLLVGSEASELALKRLKVMVSNHDGLALAEMDLQMRGAGDAIGTQQSGEAGFRLLDFVEDAALVRHWYENMPNFQFDDAMANFWRPMRESVD